MFRILVAIAVMFGASVALADDVIQLGPRPAFLVDDMDEGPLKTELKQCLAHSARRTDFSIAHRGAPLQFPEHTKEAYDASARMGAGIMECDVTFTKDKQLVCRHSQCDLHTTTNVLAIPELAAKCSQSFSPADAASGKAASAKCCTSDFTLAEYRRLQGKMDAANVKATNLEDYLRGTASWRTDLYAGRGTLMTHAESIQLFKSHGAKFTPELKEPEVAMPYDGTYTQINYAQAMIDEYKAAGIAPEDVFPQSFNLNDVLYWIAQEPAFGKQAVYLDNRADKAGGYEAAVASLPELAAKGVKIVAPPIWVLLTIENGKIVPSSYAKAAKAAGLEIITWSFERDGPLAKGGGYYFQSVKAAINNDGDMLTALDVLAREVGIKGMFSDWPATVTFYANCTGK
jgi:glycerophosphoryl diester phosphodiesterase